MVKSQEQKVCEIQVVYKDFRFQSTIGFSELGAGGVFRSYFKVRIHFIEIYKDSGYLWHEQKNSTSKQYNIVFSVEYNNMHKEYSSFFAIMLFFLYFLQNHLLYPLFPQICCLFVSNCIFFH